MVRARCRARAVPGRAGAVLRSPEWVFPVRNRAPGVAALGSLFLSPTAAAGMRDALTVSLLVQVAMVALTVLLSLRPPRTVS